MPSKGVVIESKAGREAILAKTVIDCTGDGDVAFRAGVECRKGDAEGGMQPPTLMFCMKGVDVQRLRDAIVGHPDVYDMDVMPARTVPHGQIHHRRPAQRRSGKAAEAAGIPYSGGAHDPHHRDLADDEIWVNMTRVSGVDSTTSRELYATGRSKDANRFTRLANATCANFVPGFAERPASRRSLPSWVSARAA